MLFTHSSFIKKGRGENLTASGKILVFRIAAECRVMWNKLEQKNKASDLVGGGKGVYSFPPYSSNPPVSG